MATASLIISIMALGISGLTAWLTLLRRGTVKMTRPTVIFFGPDQPIDDETVGKPKVFLRSLLFSTAKRGAIIESMFVTLARNESRQSFNIWVYGEQKLVRGSGLFVPEAGFSANHHFLAPNDGHAFSFEPGRYRITVFANVLGRKKTLTLLSQDLDVSDAASGALKSGKCGLYFDWSPATGTRAAFAHAARAGDPHLLPGILAKVTATQTAVDVASEAVSLHGARGLVQGNLADKLFRDARASLVEDGDNHLLGLKAGTYLSEAFRGQQTNELGYI